MTIGINPNLTAFSPGPLGASWCYPNFSSDGDTDEWTKFAYYYRYRSVYQERFDLRFAERFLQQEGKIVAPRPGYVTSVPRLSDAPGFTMTVRYDGDTQDTAIDLPGTLGTPRYVVLLNASPSPSASNRFAQGDVIAAILDVPPGEPAEIYAEQQAYYQQIVPTLAQFNAFLKSRGHVTANVRPGEDVGQLDMVACASPHGYYDAHAMLASVLEEGYLKGKLAYTDPIGDDPGYLTRADGPCTFCVNDFWQFPQGCPYNKPAEPQLPLGFLEQVAAQIIATAAASQDAAKKAAESKQLTDVVIKPTSP